MAIWLMKYIYTSVVTHMFAYRGIKYEYKAAHKYKMYLSHAGVTSHFMLCKIFHTTI